MGNILNSFSCDYQTLVENAHRNTLSSIGAAFLFFTGWWIILDVAATNYHDFSNGYYTCGVLGSIAFFMINSVTNAQLREDGFNTEGCLGARGVKLWLFFGIVLGFSSLISAIWILFRDFLFVTSTNPSVRAGVALFLHNFMIFLATYIYKLGRSEELW